MLRHYFRSLAFAAGFYPMVAAEAAYEVNTGPLSPAMHGTFQRQPSLQNDITQTCAPGYRATFDDESLKNINNFLGEFKDWLAASDRFDENYLEDFFGERDLSQEEELVYNSYVMIFEHEEYEAGTAHGLDFLRSNESEMFSIIYAYANHAAAQKYMLDKDVEPRSLIEMANTAERMEALALRNIFSEKFLETMMDLYEFTQTAAQLELQINEGACMNTSPIAQPN